jgi:hypothetical protein
MNMRVLSLAAAAACTLASGCLTVEESAAGTARLSATATPPREFCSLTERSPQDAAEAPSADANETLGRSQYWGRQEVQAQVRRVLRSDAFGCSPHSAYVAAYAAMTDARDVARCLAGSPMKPETVLDTRLNDALSDIMTRNYLQIAEGCQTRAAGAVSASADLRNGFCEMHARAKRENWSALRVALGSTAHYLSTHIALALSTLPHVDALWVGTGATTIHARVVAMRGYRKNYQAFNQFLGDNVLTVIRALKSGGLAPADFGSETLQLIASLGPAAPIASGIIGNRRDVAFETALRIAELIPQGQHPWTVVDPNGQASMRAQIADAPAFPRLDALTYELAQIAAEGAKFEAALSNPLMQLFGGHTFQSLNTTANQQRCQPLLSSY